MFKIEICGSFTVQKNGWWWQRPFPKLEITSERWRKVTECTEEKNSWCNWDQFYEFVKVGSLTPTLP